MAAALRPAEGRGYIFSKSSEGIYSKIFRPGGYTPYPPIPDPWSLLSERFLITFDRPIQILKCLTLVMNNKFYTHTHVSSFNWLTRKYFKNGPMSPLSLLSPL